MRTFYEYQDWSARFLAELMKKENIYLDDAFQSNTRWGIRTKQTYIASVLEGRAITPITLGKISSLRDTVEREYGYEHEDFKYFSNLLDSGFEWITIDGNNRDNTLCEFLNGEFPLQENEYRIDYNNLSVFNAT